MVYRYYIQWHNKREYASHVQANILYIFWSCMSGMWTLHCTHIQYTIIISHHESLSTLKHLSLQSLRKRTPHLPIPIPRKMCHTLVWTTGALVATPTKGEIIRCFVVAGHIKHPVGPACRAPHEETSILSLVRWLVQWWWGCQQEIQHLKQRIALMYPLKIQT